MSFWRVWPSHEHSDYIWQSVLQLTFIALFSYSRRGVSRRTKAATCRSLRCHTLLRSRKPVEASFQCENIEFHDTCCVSDPEEMHPETSSVAQSHFYSVENLTNTHLNLKKNVSVNHFIPHTCSCGSLSELFLFLLGLH